MEFVKFLSIISLIFVINCFLIRAEDDIKRTLTATLNPECPPYICDDRNNNITLIHIRADSAWDSLHYVWDFTGKPTFMVALTDKNVNFTMNWDKFMNGDSDSVKFTHRPVYTFMTVVNTIFQFDDPEDTGKLDSKKTSQIIEYNLQNLTWTRTNLRKSADEVVVEVSALNNFFLKLKLFSTKNHEDEYPHLLHSSNTTQVDLILNNINTTFKSPRFGIELILVTSEKLEKDTPFIMNEKKSLDDEHTPGIFEIFETLSPQTAKEGTGSYIQYRPVSYSRPDRDISTSTAVKQNDPIFYSSPTKELENTLAFSYYGYLLETVLLQGVNVTIGEKSDGFYSKTNYATFTFLVGYGLPPSEELSLLVILVASIGVGVPLLLLVIGGTYICVKRIRSQ